MLHSLPMTNLDPSSGNSLPRGIPAALLGITASWVRLWAATGLLLGTHVLALAASTSGSDEADEVVRTMTTEFMNGFRAIDSDNDGLVDLTAMVRSLRSVGYGQAQPARRGRGAGADPFEQFESLDADGDGMLRGDEPGPYMRQHESFKDGEVTLEEFRQAWAELPARRGSRAGRGGGGNRRGGGRRSRRAAVR